jgi:hypothetical protein
MTGRESAARSSDGDDARLAFVYSEAVRGLTQQQAQLGSLHARAATLIFAMSFSSSLLGSAALGDGLGAWDWVAIMMLFGIGGLTVILLWPYYNFHFRFDVRDLLTNYVDADPPASLAEMHRRLAIRVEDDRERNARILRRLREALQVALVLLLAEILAWLFSISQVATS